MKESSADCNNLLVGIVVGTEEVKIHCTGLNTDLIDLYKKSFSSRNVSFRIIDDRGKMEEGKGAGVARDVFSTFWQQAFSSVTVEKVPATI